MTTYSESTPTPTIPPVVPPSNTYTDTAVQTASTDLLTGFKNTSTTLLHDVITHGMVLLISVAIVYFTLRHFNRLSGMKGIGNPQGTNSGPVSIEEKNRNNGTYSTYVTGGKDYFINNKKVSQSDYYNKTGSV